MLKNCTLKGGGGLRVGQHKHRESQTEFGTKSVEKRELKVKTVCDFEKKKKNKKKLEFVRNRKLPCCFKDAYLHLDMIVIVYLQVCCLALDCAN